jgi:hypothetical protein
MGLAKVALMMPLCFGQGLEFTLKKSSPLYIFMGKLHSSP